MKKPQFIIVFFATQLFIVFFYISHQAQLIKLSYQKQKLEKKIDLLLTEKEKIKNELLMAQNKTAIKKFAQSKLGFETIKLTQIKSLKDESGL